jgi:hypothetical protein
LPEASDIIPVSDFFYFLRKYDLENRTILY